jgi:hypothetical protein
MRDGRYETTSGRLQNGYGGNAPWLCRDAQALRHSRNVTIVILARSAETVRQLRLPVVRTRGGFGVQSKNPDRVREARRSLK